MLTRGGHGAGCDARFWWAGSGRRGRAEEAAATVAAWDATRLPWAWLRHLGRRLVAEAALADGWGEPRTWLTEAAAFFDGFGTRRRGAVSAPARRPGRPSRRPAAWDPARGTALPNVSAAT